MTQLVFIPGLAAVPVHPHATVTDVHMCHATLPDMAVALLQAYSGDLILCGASMGGMLAMEAVRQAPRRIRALAWLARLGCGGGTPIAGR